MVGLLISLLSDSFALSEHEWVFLIDLQGFW